MKLTDEQKLEMYKIAIPILQRNECGYCGAFQCALIGMGIDTIFAENDPYDPSWKEKNMDDFRPFFYKHITSPYLLPFGGIYTIHRIAVLKYLINQLEIKLYGEVITDFSNE